MTTHVVSVRAFPFEGPAPYVYVGRPMDKLFRGHPLANPFRLPRKATDADRLACLLRYRRWLAEVPDLDALLASLAARTRGVLPLACWCGSWQPGGPELLCHAVVLAELLNARAAP